MSDLREALTNWPAVYAAFTGAFDTPVERRKHSNEYTEDARKRLREFNDLVLAVLAQPEAGELVFLGSPDHKAVAARLRGYANDPMWADHGEVPKSLLFEVAQLLTTLPIAPDERMRRALPRPQDHCLATCKVNGCAKPDRCISEIDEDYIRGFKDALRADDNH